MPTWVDKLFQRETLPVLESGMGFAHQKQLVVMNNIANVRTPYYKRKQLPENEFREKLKMAINEREDLHPNEWRMDDGLDVRFVGPYPRMRMFNGQEWGPERHSENSVVIEKEMADLAKNQLMMSGMQQLFRKKLTMMRMSLRDKV